MKIWLYFFFVVNISILVIVDLNLDWLLRDVMQVLLIGGSTGTMLESLQVIGDAPDVHLDVSWVQERLF